MANELSDAAVIVLPRPYFVDNKALNGEPQAGRGMTDSRKSMTRQTAASVRPDKAGTTRWWCLAIGLLCAAQIGISLSLWRVTRGREFSSDVAEYDLYLADPNLLFRSQHEQPTVGGKVAAPFLPWMLALPYRVVSAVAPPFLALRGTMIFWSALGAGIGWWVALRHSGPPYSRLERGALILLALLPVGWIASAVLTQDDAIAAGWSGLCVLLWRRFGAWGGFVAAALAMWFAKPFFVLYFLALWIAYPRERVRLTLAGTAWVALLLGFIWWRDGSFTSLRHTVHPYMGGNLYAIWWIFSGDYTPEAVRAFRGSARGVGSVLTILVLGGWAYSGWKKPRSFPTALVGAYSLFFAVFVGMMPEYEYWYFAWVILVLWAAVKRGDWLTAAIGWSHSAFGYAYKVLYACDGRTFHKAAPSPLQAWYERNLNYDLRPLLLLTAAMTVVGGLALAYRLYRHDPFTVEGEGT